MDISKYQYEKFKCSVEGLSVYGLCEYNYLYFVSIFLYTALLYKHIVHKVKLLIDQHRLPKLFHIFTFIYTVQKAMFSFSSSQTNRKCIYKLLLKGWLAHCSDSWETINTMVIVYTIQYTLPITVYHTAKSVEGRCCYNLK